MSGRIGRWVDEHLPAPLVMVLTLLMVFALFFGAVIGLLLILAFLPHVLDVLVPIWRAFVGVLHTLVDAFPVWGCASRVCPT